jgi:type II secretory pathway pseudopilin PulG
MQHAVASIQLPDDGRGKPVMGQRSGAAYVSPYARAGATLVELLVAIAVISLLISLLIPAVQAAREAARRTACRNHLRQIGIAALNHEAAYRHFPTNGWGFQWIGEPDRGADEQQPGGWIYNLLPYVEQDVLRKTGAGFPDADRRAALTELSRTPLVLFNCPSRPSPPVGPANPDVVPFNAEWQPFVAKSDYAVNEGDWISNTGPGPPTLEEGDRRDFPWPDLSQATGVSFQRSRVRAANITAGLSQTYLVGEKYVNVHAYLTADDLGHDQSMYGGVDLDLNRWTLETPIQDGEGPAVRSFGSAHAAGCHFVYCDGSVRTVSYSVDGQVHRLAGNRQHD